MKNVRSSQPRISMNFCTEFSKAQVFPCVYRQGYCSSQLSDYKISAKSTNCIFHNLINVSKFLIYRGHPLITYTKNCYFLTLHPAPHPRTNYPPLRFFDLVEDFIRYVTPFQKIGEGRIADLGRIAQWLATCARKPKVNEN